MHELVHVEVLAANGERETLSGTSIHPIWSVERHDWVPLGELVIGETLQGSAGLARVLGLTVASATTAVYNIEVHGHHVYQVGKIGLLVHNTCADEVLELAPGQLAGGFMTRGGKLIAPLFTNTAGGHPEAVLAVSGLTSRLQNGSAFAFSVGKRMDGTIDVSPSGAFPVTGGLTNAMKAMVLKYVK